MARAMLRTRLPAVLVLAAVLLFAGPVSAEEASRTEWPLGDRVFDALVLRPLGALGTVSGFALFVCSAPVSGAALRIDEAWETFVQRPAEYTFTRSLGDF